MDRSKGYVREGGIEEAEKEGVMLFVMYNIRNGWNSRNGVLESVFCGMAQANISLKIFQETKITKGVYAHKSEGYKVVASNALSRHCGVVEIL